MSDVVVHRPAVLLAVDKPALELSKLTAEQVQARLATLPCSTLEQEQAFADFLTRTKEELRKLEDERETLVRPLIDDKAEIDGLYRGPRKAWEQVEATIKGKIGAAREARAKAAQEAKGAAIKAAQENALLALQAHDAGAVGRRDELMKSAQTALAVAAQAHEQTQVKVDGAATNWEWVARIEDQSQVPREWLCIDWSKVKIHCREFAASNTIPEVPGLRFERKAKVVAR